MNKTAIRTRDEIPEADKWNAGSVFATPAAWEAEYQNVSAGLGELRACQGRLGEGPGLLAAALAERDELLRRAAVLQVYASISRAVDTGNQAAAALESRANGLLSQALAAAAFIEPELLALGGDRLLAWLDAPEAPGLANYRHYVENLLRNASHVRSAEVEELLGSLRDAFAGANGTADALSYADMRFPDARAADGSALPLTQGTLQSILARPDREARRTAWENYYDTYLAYKNTYASTLTTSIKQNVLEARSRRHNSTLEAALFANAIPPAVYHNLIATYRENLPTWQRYWAVRRRALRVEKLYPYDLWAPLAGTRPEITFDQAVDMIGAGLAPLGREYVAALRRGCLEERWVDRYANLGKTAGAFSSGAKGTYPFIVMSFDGTIYSMSTLAHELGHSMHSYLTWTHQPTVYADYSLFVAEVASNFHQAMVRGYLLDSNPDPAFQMSVIEEAMNNFHRYFFVMPTLARFELEVHERVERGEGLAADDMIQLMANLFAEGYGSEMAFDRARVGITWATFSHLYADYYVYQYATGISAAHALAKRIREGAPGAVEAYLGFLQAGGSVYPLEALRQAGVDLTSPEPVRTAFAVLAGLVDRLERLVAGSLA